MENRILSMLFGILLLQTYTGFADAQCMEIPGVDTNTTNIICDSMICNITCEDGYELEGNSTILCACPEDLATTPPTPENATTMMPGGPDRVLDSNCTWNVSNIPQCVPILTSTEPPQVVQTSGVVSQTTKEQLTKPTEPPKYITWEQFWIATGLLIGFVVLLLVATAFLLCQYFRGKKQPPPPVPRAHTNSAFEAERHDSFNDIVKQESRNKPNYESNNRQTNSYAHPPQTRPNPSQPRIGTSIPFTDRPKHQPPTNSHPQYQKSRAQVHHDSENTYDDNIDFDKPAPKLPPPNPSSAYADTYENSDDYTQPQGHDIYEN